MSKTLTNVINTSSLGHNFTLNSRKRLSCSWTLTKEQVYLNSRDWIYVSYSQVGFLMVFRRQCEMGKCHMRAVKFSQGKLLFSVDIRWCYLSWPSNTLTLLEFYVRVCVKLALECFVDYWRLVGMNATKINIWLETCSCPKQTWLFSLLSSALHRSSKLHSWASVGIQTEQLC